MHIMLFMANVGHFLFLEYHFLVLFSYVSVSAAGFLLLRARSWMHKRRIIGGGMILAFVQLCRYNT